MYLIYEIKGPTGKSYVGRTRSTLKERWRQHVNRAFNEGNPREFYADIRQYGPDAFSCEILDYALTKKAADESEIQHIAQLENPYNLSPGGQYDGKTANAEHWRRYREDPEYREKYLISLAAGVKMSDRSEAIRLSQIAITQWRKDCPREVYTIARRASRVAARLKKGNAPAEKEELSLKERLWRKHKNSEFRSQYISKIWEGRSEEERREIFDKAAETKRKSWAAITDPAERAAKTAVARAAIDRKKQGAAASKGIKSFWEELRKDPERYAAHMEARRASQEALRNDPVRWAAVLEKRRKSREANKK